MKRLIFVIATVVMAACGSVVDFPPADLGAQYDFNPDDMDAPDAGLPPAGGLPLGYNERGCQWDACGGPLPDHQSYAVNPIR